MLGPVPWDDFPMFIFNKGTSLAAFILLTFNFSFGPMNNVGVTIPSSWLNARKALGMTGFLLVLIHAFISFLLFRPAIYAQFFESDGSLTAIAGISMLAGIFGLVVLWAYNLSFQTHMREDKKFISFITSRKFLLFALTLGIIHIFFMGYNGWLNPDGWHGGLPPISLVAFTFCLIGYIFNLIGRK
ncbi:hypothetical protein BST85_06975 [Aureitalea marina]|uniref:Ferric oxidoreductase domain-containing protein n=1 Tax=Aureitalea marina TaxID=930804 RepID=A0A2S7KPW9_9FLAO|nr:hypothetical protein BST85_06975 [Aureitalea marina]